MTSKIFTNWNGPGTAQPGWTPALYSETDARQLLVGPTCINDGLEIEFSTCRRGLFSLPHSDRNDHKYFLLYPETAVPFVSLFCDSYARFVLL